MKVSTTYSTEALVLRGTSYKIYSRSGTYWAWRAGWPEHSIQGVGVSPVNRRLTSPPPITDPNQVAQLDIRRRQRLDGILNEYDHAA
jgi:hypothetical protein